ncbi:hypothetical protein GCM10027267_32170 [Paramicrobacterium agarici]
MQKRLLEAVVLQLLEDVEAQNIAVPGDARVNVRDRKRHMMDAADSRSGHAPSLRRRMALCVPSVVLYRAATVFRLSLQL